MINREIMAPPGDFSALCAAVDASGWQYLELMFPWDVDPSLK